MLDCIGDTYHKNYTHIIIQYVNDRIFTLKQEIITLSNI